jgi:hypothetical protein
MQSLAQIVLLLAATVQEASPASEPDQVDRIEQLLQCSAYALFDPDDPTYGKEYVDEARRIGGKALEKDLMKRLADSQEKAMASSYERYKQGSSNDKLFVQRAVACRELLKSSAAPTEGR